MLIDNLSTPDMFTSPVAIGLSPNTESDDVWEAIKIILKPWVWKNGSALGEVERWFKKYFATKDVYLFNSGRSSLYAILKSFDVGKGDEILVQAFTCVAVPDPIIWNGAMPVYIDIDETLNIDSSLLERYITSKTKAIIVQHTFGIPAKIETIKKIAQKHKIVLIEDCAHSLGIESNGKKVGTFGDAAIFSFGRDKVISSVFGGMAIINQKSNVIRQLVDQKLRKFQHNLPYPSYFWIFQQLLHPIAFSLILPLYNFFSVGKIILFILQKFCLLSKPIYKEESIGEKPSVFPKRYPNALGQLLIRQLNKLDRYNRKRKQIANYYYKALCNKKNVRLPSKSKGAIYLRFNILTDKAEDLLAMAKKRGMLLGNWYKNIVDPQGVDYQKVHYQKGSCQKAEEAAKLTVNLPTYPRLTQEDLNQMIQLFS